MKWSNYVRFGKCVEMDKYVRLGIYTILVETLGAVQAGVKLVCPLSSIGTRFPDIVHGIFHPFLRSCVVALPLSGCRRVDVTLESVLEPGEGGFHIHSLLVRRGGGVDCVLLRFGRPAAIG